MIPESPKKTAEAVAGMLIAGLLAIVVLGGLGYVGWLKWKAGKAERAIEAAKTAQANADSADAGAENATRTRQTMDAVTVDLRINAEQSARRIEHADPAAGQPGAGADVMRELVDAESGYRAAADRLQRARPR